MANMRNHTSMNMNAKIQRALQYHQSGDLEQAADIYKKLLQNNPNHSDLLHLLGILTYQKNDGAEAEMLINQAIQIDPANPFYYCSLADVLIEKGLLDEAIASYLKSLQLKPDFDVAHYNLGNVFADTGDSQSAISCYQQALAINPNLAEAHYNLAHVFQKLEAYDKAADHYRTALQLNPDHFYTYFHLANLLLDHGQLEEAVSHYQNALKLNPNHADTHNNLGRALNDLGKFKQASIYFQNAVTLEPEFTEAHFNLGTAFKNQKKTEDAIACYKKSLELKPTLVIAYQALGNLLHDQGNYDEATSLYKEVLQIKPDLPEVYYNLGNIARDQGRLEEAVDDFKKALELNPDFAKAYNNLGVIHKDQNRLDEAVDCYQKTLQLQPTLVEAHYNLGIIHQLRGRYQEGLKFYHQALKLNPAYSPARWLYYLSLPILYDSKEDITAHRKRFRDNLAKLIEETKLDTTEDKAIALKGVGSMTNFYLQYQGLNDLDLQKAYGNLVCTVMAANYPQWSTPLNRPAFNSANKIRIGYVSSFMYAHTVGIYLMSWLENHDLSEFEIFCYHIGNKTDAITKLFQDRSDHFCQIGGNVEAAARQIISDNLDVLVFTDIGMHAPATQLAGLRLAPVQCKGWGHPITTGLPTIDYYLSSDLMEPENAQNHYSEKLIRLPNLALAYRKPILPEHPKTRQDFGIKDDAFIYLISQSVFKLLPQYDAIYPCIALKVPKAQFIFISHSSAEVTAKFKHRLAKAFGALQLNLDDCCVFVPRLNHPDFLSLNCVSDVLLDTFYWSGGKTTLEGISCDLPVVTCPGKFMRGRHAYAMLTMMGVIETIAASEAEYIDIAVRLGLDKKYYLKIKSLIKENQTRLYEDKTCVLALEEFYRFLIQQHKQPLA
ncbi:MAG: tetratricopeptide repeat protein [Desulfobacterales bacterium]